MRAAVLLVAGISIALPTWTAQAQHRELGPHQHGHGTLNIAIEGGRVSMELDVPGADIVGFEHAATTKAQRTAVEKAKAELAAPLSVFVVPKGAGCSVKEANVKIEGAEEAKAEQAKDAPAGKKEEAGAEHSDFNADYVLECTAVDKLTSIEFPYFRKFSGAQELEINLVTAKGQNKFEVKRGKPRLDLTGAQ
jgi:phosphoketolase